MKHLVLFFVLFSFSVRAKLLDKIFAVIDGRPITLSTLKRVKQNLGARQKISPLVYQKLNYNNKEIVEILINSVLIRTKLEEMGYVISDAQVESQVKATEGSLGLDRASLLSFLASNNLSFDEYFELTREAIEFNVFSSRFIRPLISVTDQEIKNHFYKKNASNKHFNFKYTLVDFSLSKSNLKKNMLAEFSDVLEKFQNTGVLPNRYANLSTNVLGDIAEDGLTSELIQLLKKTDEGSFTAPILLSDDYHVFFIKKKNLVESGFFSRQKETIKAELMKDVGLRITASWFARVKNKHYVKYFY